MIAWLALASRIDKMKDRQGPSTPECPNADSSLPPLDALALLDLAPVLGRSLDNRILHWGKGAEALYGYSAKEALGRVSHELLRTIPPAPFAVLDAQLMAEGRWKGELTHTRKDGVQIIVVSEWVLQGAPKGVPFAILEVNQDISESKRDHFALLESQANLRTVFDSVNDGILVHTQDGVVIEVNQRFLSMYGVSREQAGSLSIPQLSSPSAPLDTLPDIWSKVLAGQNQSFEWRARRPGDSQEFDVEVFLSRIRLEGRDAVLATVRDITSLKQAEQSLRRQNQQLSVLNAAAEVLLSSAEPAQAFSAIYDRLAEYFEVDYFIEFGLDKTGEWLEVLASQAAAGAAPPHLTRIRLGEGVAGKVARSREPIVVANVQQTSEPDLRAIRAIGAHAYACEPLVIDGHLVGTLSFASFRRFSFTPQDQEFFRTLANYLALAKERYRLNRELREHALNLETAITERTTQLLEANANLQSFAYTAAHDLRSPLRSIRSFSAIALEECGDTLGPEGRSYLQRVAQSAEQMGNLLNDLLEYSKLNQGDIRLEPVSLEKAVKDALDLVQQEVQNRQAELTLQAPMPSVIGHAATIVLVLTNFVSNALKFTSPETQPKIRIGTENHDSSVRVFVEDNGIGIEPKDQDKLFQLFQRLHGKNAYPGTGLGLAIVRRAVERMGGAVGVNSTPGQGSCFWAEFRAAA